MRKRLGFFRGGDAYSTITDTSACWRPCAGDILEVLYGELSSSEQRVVQCMALSPSSLSHEAVVALAKAIAIDGTMLSAALATNGCCIGERL